MNTAYSSPLHSFSLLTPLGVVLVAGRGQWLYGLWFEGQKHSPRDRAAWGPPTAEDTFIDDTREWLEAYFSVRPISPRLHIALCGTVFRRCVWQMLSDIPVGRTVSYGKLAQRVSQHLCYSPKCIRATATAVSHNPISIVLPCHRILPADGSLGQYAGGTSRKAALLALEQHHTDAFPPLLFTESNMPIAVE